MSTDIHNNKEKNNSRFVQLLLKITSVAIAICFSFRISTVGTIYAQQPPNLSKVIKDKYTTTDADGAPYVRVVYESSNTILLQGELIATQFNTPDLVFNSDLWSAMDLLKNQYGYKLQQIMTTGIGSLETLQLSIF
jgi:hypothetical protein